MTTTTLPDVPEDASAAIRLKALIKDRGYTNVTQFAKANNIPYEALASHVSGRRQIYREKAELYAVALRCSVDWILYGRISLTEKGTKEYDTRLPVKYLLRSLWGDGEIDKEWKPSVVDFPMEIRTKR